MCHWATVIGGSRTRSSTPSPPGTTDWPGSRSGLGDLPLPRRQELLVGLWTVANDARFTRSDRSAWGGKIDYPNDRWDLFFIYEQFGNDLDPALGFLPRPGTRWYQGGGAFQPRPQGDRWSWIRQLFFETFVTRVDDIDGGIQSWRVFTAPVNVEFESGDRAEFNVAPQFEHLDDGFEVADGIVVPPGDHHFTRDRLEVESSDHRPWVMEHRVWWGDFYTGDLVQWTSELRLTALRGHGSLGLEVENDFGDLPEGAFTQRLWELEAVYAASADLSLSMFAQYDSESRSVGMNARLRWTLRPGDDVFLVWNHDWKRPFGQESWSRLDNVGDQWVAKLRWTWRP